MPGNFVGPGSRAINNIIQSPKEYQSLFERAKPDQLRGDISPDYLYFYQNAVPKILNEIDAKIPIIIVLRNPIDRAYSHYFQKIRNGAENLSFEAALDAEADRRASRWIWGWRFVDVGLYAQQVKAYLDSFERVLLLLFEEDIVTGRATDKVLNFLNLDPLPTNSAAIQAHVSGQPQNRWLHRLMTDELVVRKVKEVIKATPLSAASKRLYRKMMKANLKKEEIAAETRQVLKEKFQDDVALLAEYTGLPVQKFWMDFDLSSSAYWTRYRDQ